MNKQRLKHIAKNTYDVSDSEIVEIKQLIGDFPFYALPYVVLSKIYFEKEHYLFENALTQAAMRVADREWLYHYVHGDINKLPEQIVEHTVLNEIIFTEKSDSSFIQPDKEVLFAEESPYLPDSEILLNQSIPEMDISENDSTIELPEEKAMPELSEVQSLNSNNINEFLEISAVPEPVEAIVSDIQEQVLPPEEREIYLEETFQNKDKVPEMASVETDDHTINAELENTELIEMAMNLRKHPVYNVEDFLQAETKKSADETEDEKDFFYWLKHPTQETESVAQEEIKLDTAPKEKSNIINIIDQFIMANPGISRPKKEFFNAENMAKKSEHLDIDFVTETLANIYYEQGNIDQAVKAYEKLSLQNPLKQTYFASLIEKIKKEKR